MIKNVQTNGIGGQSTNARSRIKQSYELIAGQSSAFRSIINKIKTVAAHNCPVIIMGETGSGKEVVARQIHAHSYRAENAFLPVDCTALSGLLFESQLFGHMKGSFTGAVNNTLGFFRAADNSTIFLDEIEELNLDLQAKLLRVLEESCVVPIGSTKSYPVNVRVLCSTNRSLHQMVSEGTFRADLYFRINVVTLQIPPLREHKEDVPVLAEYFLRKQAELYNKPLKRLTASAVDILTNYSWPGNIRELANIMENVVVMNNSHKIEASNLPAEILAADILPSQEKSFPTMAEVNKKLVIRALEVTNGRKMAAAKLLSIDYGKLSRLIKKYHLYPNYR